MRIPQRLWGKWLAILILGTAAVPASAQPAAGKSRAPNIIFIIADDLGWGELGSYGQKKIKTPNLDRLAAQGMRFTQHYSGSPVCAPSRCVLMTGKHTGHSIVRDNLSPGGGEGQYPLPKGTTTLASLLKALGYATGGFGKWGLGGPNNSGSPELQGFDRFYGYLCQGKAHNFYPPYLWDNDKKVPLNNKVMKLPDKLPPDADPKDPKSYKPYVGNEFSGDLIFDQARQFVRANKDRPFFLYVPTTIPHVSLQVPEDSLAEYRGKWDDSPYVGGNGYLPQQYPRAAYAAMITRLDKEVGKIMDLITELGLDDDTIFVFTSDNGPLGGGYAGTDGAFFLSNGGLRGYKGSLYEGGFRVPCIVRWRGRIAPGSTADRVTGFEDWMPTLLELVGNAKGLPAGVDGISFAPTLLGKKQAERPFLYREFPSYGGQQLVRIGDWTGIRQGLMPNKKAKNQVPNLHIELYNLARDLKQTKDVSAEHPDMIARMQAILREQHVPSEVFPIPALDKMDKK